MKLAGSTIQTAGFCRLGGAAGRDGKPVPAVDLHPSVTVAPRAHCRRRIVHGDTHLEGARHGISLGGSTCRTRPFAAVTLGSSLRASKMSASGGAGAARTCAGTSKTASHPLSRATVKTTCPGV